MTVLRWAPCLDAASLPSLGAEESEQLEYKEGDWKTGDKGTIEIAKDIAQFANHFGGSIIIGAREDAADRLVGYVPVDAQLIATRVRDAAYARLSPRPSFDCVPVVKDGMNLLAINVPPHQAAVGVALGDDKWAFVRRFQKGKKPISFEEVERMWTDGRRGKLILLKIPQAHMSQIALDAEATNPAFTSGQVQLRLYDDFFAVTLNNGQAFNFPYEFVRAAWPSAIGGWIVSLTVRFELAYGGGGLRAGYSS